MNRASRTSIIPKIIVILGTLSVAGIILLFFRRGDETIARKPKPDTADKLFQEIIRAAEPQFAALWAEGHRFLQGPTNCKEEIISDPKIGGAYFGCQPHFWQCYWQGGVKKETAIKVDLYGQTYHVKALPSFPVIDLISPYPRHIEMQKISGSGLNLTYGYQIDLGVEELPGKSQRVLLTDSCRDVYLPERIYGYGKRPDKGEGFIWDNFGRRIFIDRFYVTNQMVNAWRILTGKTSGFITDRALWPWPAELSSDEQKNYCAFLGKRPLTALLFDAAAMTPTDLREPKPRLVTRAQTPWQRDLSRTFLGMARINPDHQLTPLDCQLAQVKGCPEKIFTTDSASWMGMHYPMGFFAEALQNELEPELNMKYSSRNLPAASPWHELGYRTARDEKKSPELIAFRCYEEVEP